MRVVKLDLQPNPTEASLHESKLRIDAEFRSVSIMVAALLASEASGNLLYSVDGLP